MALVVPVRNEYESLPQLRVELAELVALGVHVIVVNDGDIASCDPLSEVGCDVISTGDTHGFGAAVKVGLDHASRTMTGSGYVCWMPGNLRVRALYALAAARHLDQLHAYGSAWVKTARGNRPIFDRFTALATSLYLSAVARERFFEFGGTPTVIPIECVSLLLDGPDDVTFEAYTLWRMQHTDLSLIRLVAPFGPRPHGSSKWNTGILSKFRLLARSSAAVRTFYHDDKMTEPGVDA